MDCKNQDCKKLAISFSNYCGEHSDEAEVLSQLKQLQGRVTNLLLSELNIETIEVTGVQFDQLTLSDCHFEEVVFKNCSFIFSSLSNSRMVAAHFIDCEFVRTDWKNLDLGDECRLLRSNFEHCDFVGTHFNECNRIEKTSLVGCEFTSSTFYGIDQLNDNVLRQCSFFSSNISEIHLTQSRLVDSVFQRTRIEDAVFENCTFDHIEHDFDQGELPKLCRFNNNTLSSTTLPTLFYQWNGIDKEASLFYLELIERVKLEDHANSFWILNICAERLIEHWGDDELEDFAQEIISIYRDKWIKFLQIQEYGVLGNIIKQYNELPSSFKRTAPLLSAPQSRLDAPSISIIIKIQCSSWTQSNVASIQTQLAQIESALKPTAALTIQRIEQGSIIQVLTGNLDTILQLGGVLASITTFFVLTINGIQKMMVQSVELEQKRLALKQQNVRQDLENQKLALEIEELTLDIKNKYYDSIKKMTLDQDWEIEHFRNSEQAEEAEHLAQELDEQFKIESVEVKIEEHQK